MTTSKSYVISKQVVWEAYQTVKANRGAAGVDEESIEAFEQNLEGNLHKLWNRLSSGSAPRGYPPDARPSGGNPEGWRARGPRPWGADGD